MPPLRPETVYVWQADASQVPAGAHDVLSAEERARAGRFRRLADRTRFTASHAALRQILARYAGTAADALVFETRPQGKPALVRLPGSPDLRFSLSHSGSFALVALSLGREVGVDVEQERPLPDLLRLAQRVASPDELGVLARLDGLARQRAFFRLWVAKEAVLKAQGTGLHADPRRLSLHAFQTDQLRLDEATARNGWALAMLGAPPGYRAALAAATPLRSVSRHLLPFGD